MPSLYYESGRYISFVDGLFYSSSLDIPPGSLIDINGYMIRKPAWFKNKAHARAFEIALVFAQKKPEITYKQRMGDEVICFTSPLIMTTSECIDAIMFNGIHEIQLSIDAVNPNVVAHRAMDKVAGIFESGKVQIRKHPGNKMWYLELTRDE